ncbi:Imm6 family immunity protein [Clostridium sp. ZBS15]|uniref:Imm6 family immunity protein n=1 Tax=Clostridium sp. ZBS15 TaxID=2949969 RepID=UPI00207AE010|nr:Imm6 family immunity protein [Clostridium sp. ZBS15]
MELQRLGKLKDEIKVGFVITIAEKVFSKINKTDDRYVDGRDALNKCWTWVENNGISGDDLYELIDNAECTGISEFVEDEEDLNIARLWSLLVDTVSYTSWMAYKKENTKYLPQSLEGIKEESFIILIESAIETSFITKDEIIVFEQQLLSNYQISDDKIAIIRDDFMKKIMSAY